MNPVEAREVEPKLSFWAQQVPWMGVMGYLLSPLNIFVAWKSGKTDVLDWTDMVWTIGMFWTPIFIGMLFTRVAKPSHRIYRLGLAVFVATWLGPIVLAQVFPLWRDLKGRP